MAACRGADANLWYAVRGEDIAPARAVCRGCPVMAQCGFVAIANTEKFGMWGGMSERERRLTRTRLGRVGMDAVRRVVAAGEALTDPRPDASQRAADRSVRAWAIRGAEPSRTRPSEAAEPAA